MILIIEILISYSFIVTMQLITYKNKNKIYWNNYQQCLMVLRQSDPELDKYLKENNNEN